MQLRPPSSGEGLMPAREVSRDVPVLARWFDEVPLRYRLPKDDAVSMILVAAERDTLSWGEMEIAAQSREDEAFRRRMLRPGVDMPPDHP